MSEELRELEIRDQFIKSDLKEVGFIHKIVGKGRLVVVHRGKREAYYASEGDPIYENDALYSLIDCRSRLGFKDKNVVIMAPDTHLDIDEIYASILGGEKRALFGMTKGRAIFYALRLFRYPKMKLQLKTPTANIGIRGTKFGTEIVEIKEGHSNIPNSMLASQSLDFAANEEEKQNIITRVYVFEGEIDVTSLIDGSVKHLGENEILEADLRSLGEVKADPERTQSFVESVMSGVGQPPEVEPQNFEDEPFREEMEKREKMIDIRQRDLEPSITPEQGGENHHQEDKSGIR